VLRCVAVCGSVLQKISESDRESLKRENCCSVLQCVAVCCSVLQYVAVRYKRIVRVSRERTVTATGIFQTAREI